MKRFLISIIALTIMSITAKGQVLPRIPNGVWQGTIKVKTNSLLIGYVGSTIAYVWDDLNYVMLKDVYKTEHIHPV